ncbi:sugar phosphate permease [Hephaestia caeni]|uniref:Sugar phosphate permease n=1 Tax=Hephaestia caeni TaxID=645617 RepID=A0A397P9C1_9SPHN|nr:MFS transporter [Hephaestia caeni]RIA45508.1 sugar phosphate permease [Hephaestia caeni]
MEQPGRIEMQAMPLAVERARPSAWWALAVLFLFYTFSFLDRYILTMLAPSIKDDLNLSDTEMGLILGAAFSICYAIFGLPLGWAADRFSRRWVIFLGVGVFGIATASTGLANSFIAVFVVRAFVGIGEAALSPAAYSLLAEKFPRHLLTTASSIFNTGAKLGTAGAYALSGVALAYAAGHLPMLAPWRFTFFVVGIPVAVMAALVFTFGEESHRAKRKQRNTISIVPYFRTNSDLLLPMVVGFILMGMVGGTLLAWTPSYITRHFGWTPIQFAPMLSVISLVAAASLIFKGGIVDWLFARGIKDAHIRFYTWLVLGIAPIAASMFFIENPIVFMIMYGMVQVVAVPFFVFVSATVQVVAPQEVKGQVIAVFLFCTTGIGSGTGPFIAGALTDYVFQDEAKLGYSLASMIFITIPAAYFCLRKTLRPLRERVIAIEEARVMYGAGQ